ncbi:serine/threonine-protein kinase [Streptomyces sp. DT2A-34]|uniref:serine/threonine-protein kinase n=1 Tax=Streptomyces sp. DT2A-34 TaxID=3051182 RepID=UPI00265C827C|nr:serine/threonine-protein kinase [Streptomyces sp. DT2A-34]MDO0917269.1 serine/threonine-protein kinase [Streptomyces sp. DT2A-34]
MVSGGEAETATSEGRLIGGRYRLGGQLGAGGMGAVWAGLDVLVGREVAVKEAYVAQGPSRVERILREARAAARVNHPSVVTVHDVVMEDGRPWIVMERVHGESLAALLERQRSLPEREAARIALCVLEALSAAHLRGVLHRDVKPGNVLLGADGRVVLSDFGIAYIAGEESLTRSGEFMGSLAYTAPERMGGSRPGPASDLWSLGVLLFQMVEGWSPFQRVSVEGTVGAVLTAKTPGTRQADALASVIADLLSKEPGERPEADRVVSALRGVAGEGASRHDVPAKSGGSGRRLWLGTAAIAVTLVLALLAMDSWPGGGKKQPSADRSPTPSHTGTPTPKVTAAKGYIHVREDEFGLDVPAGWQRHAKNADGQYRYTKGSYELVVVPGRDSVKAYPGGLIEYQKNDEPELQPYRDATWSTASGIRLVEVGDRTLAEGQFTWQRDERGQEVFARNLVLLVNGRYHLVLVLGPASERETVGRRATTTYVAAESGT